MPELERVRSELEPRGVGFLALSLSRSQPRVRSAAQYMGIKMPVAMAQSEMSGPLAVDVVPATLFIGVDGRVRALVKGAHPYEFLRARALELVE